MNRDAAPPRRPPDDRRPGHPGAAWRRFTGWLLVLAGTGMVLSGVSTLLHH